MTNDEAVELAVEQHLEAERERRHPLGPATDFQKSNEFEVTFWVWNGTNDPVCLRDGEVEALEAVKNVKEVVQSCQGDWVVCRLYGTADFADALEEIRLELIAALKLHREDVLSEALIELVDEGIPLAFNALCWPGEVTYQELFDAHEWLYEKIGPWLEAREVLGLEVSGGKNTNDD